MLKKIEAICIAVILVFGGLSAYYHFKRIPDIKEALGEVKHTPYKYLESREKYSLKEMEHILAWLRLSKVPEELRRKYANNTHRSRSGHNKSTVGGFPYKRDCNARIENHDC